MTNDNSRVSPLSTRRAYLAAASVGLAAIAGCSEDEPFPDNETDPNASPSADGQDTDPEPRSDAEPREWNVFGYDLQNTGSVDTSGPIEKPTETWQFGTDYSVDGTLSLSGGVLYAAAGTASDGILYAIDADSGDERWSVELGGLRNATPAVHEGTVYVGGRKPEPEGFNTRPPDAALYAFDAETGDPEWEYTTSDAFLLNAPPIVDSGRVYIGATTTAGSTRVFAVETDTGDEVWSQSLGDQVTSPAIDGDTLYVGSTDDYLYAFDAASGDELWRFDTGEFITTEPTVRDGTVYVGNHVGLYAVENGEEQWFYEGGGISYGLDASQAVTEDAVYIATQSVLASVSHTGEERWREETFAGGGLASHPLVTENMVYVTANDVRAHAVDTGEEQWVVEDVSATGRPITSDGVLYVAGDSGVSALE